MLLVCVVFSKKKYWIQSGSITHWVKQNLKIVFFFIFRVKRKRAVAPIIIEPFIIGRLHSHYVFFCIWLNQLNKQKKMNPKWILYPLGKENIKTGFFKFVLFKVQTKLKIGFKYSEALLFFCFFFLRTQIVWSFAI